MSATRYSSRLRRVEPALRRALRGRCALPGGSLVLVAVSGGADSTALLVGLHSIAREFGLKLRAAHLDHGLRGRAGERDRAATRVLCRRLGVPFTSERREAPRVLAERGWSGEDGLRRLRREFLEGVADRAGAAAIATAHTADDQLETLLFRLARGTGLRGMGGMRERAGRWIKPMLALARADVEHDLARAGLEWREDATNRSREHARNRIRLDVVPALRAATAGAAARAGRPRDRAGLARRASRLATELAEAELALGRGIARRLSRVSRIQGGEAWLDSRGVATYPRAARRIALRQLWRRLGGAPDGLTHRHLEALMTLLESGGPASRVELPQRRYATREGHAVLIRSASGVGRGRTHDSLAEAPPRLKPHGRPTGT